MVAGEVMLEFVAGVPPEQWMRVPFVMEQQQQTMWCWSATAVSFARFCGDNAWTQCQVAVVTLGVPTCCAHPLPDGCNRTWRLQEALATVGQFKEMSPVRLADTQIEGELLMSRAVGARIEWRGNGGHFVAISGLRRSGHETLITIEDPLYGPTTASLAVFSTAYRGAGQWTHSYLTLHGAV